MIYRIFSIYPKYILDILCSSPSYNPVPHSRDTGYKITFFLILYLFLFNSFRFIYLFTFFITHEKYILNMFFMILVIFGKIKKLDLERRFLSSVKHGF